MKSRMRAKIRGKRLNARVAKLLLKKMFFKYAGVCQACHKKCVTMHWAQKNGFVLDERSGMVQHPVSNKVFLIATVQHLKDLSEGGHNGDSNVTLFCAPCNRADNEAKRSRKA
jgi:hypothetical protein